MGTGGDSSSNGGGNQVAVTIPVKMEVEQAVKEAFQGLPWGTPLKLRIVDNKVGSF